MPRFGPRGSCAGWQRSGAANEQSDLGHRQLAARGGRGEPHGAQHRRGHRPVAAAGLQRRALPLQHRRVGQKHDGAGRLAGIYVLDDIDQLRRRTDGSARRARIETPAEEPPPLAFFIDGDGDLQLVREGEAPVLIRNADARRLVAFVAIQATAILTA